MERVGLVYQRRNCRKKFVIEYKGEVIDRMIFDQRFAKANKNHKYFFFSLGKNFYIDATVYGNEARFINHSCTPNVAPYKWSTYINGLEHTRIGLFSLRKIAVVRYFHLDFFSSVELARIIVAMITFRLKTRLISRL